jgi:Lipase (class 3)
MDAWEETKSAVFNGVNTALAENPTFVVVVTGHSLGGAVATLAGAYLRDSGIPCSIYTYGSPRVGNAAFADFVTNQQQQSDGSLSTFRITHLDDPVPRLPPMLLSYRHTSPEFWLATGDADSVSFTPDDIRVCLGIANSSCNAATSGLDITAHRFYLGPISACGPGLGFKRAERDDVTEQLVTLADLDAVYSYQ